MSSRKIDVVVPTLEQPNYVLMRSLQQMLGIGEILVTIGENALIGVGSVVINYEAAFALAYCNPARVRGFICKCGTKLEIAEENEKTVIW